jgi:putative inorganic carbon (hco3(-)) transporter
MNSPAILAIGLILGAALAVVGLFRPFLGMLVFVTIHFVQPGELIPALQPLRIELVYGTLLIAILIYRRVSRPGPSLLSDGIILGAVMLLAAALLSVPFAVWRGGAANTVIELMKLITLIPLIALLVESQKHLRMTLWCMTGLAAWFAGSCLSAYAHGQFYALGTLDRAEGINSIVGGPNELAGILLAFLPLLIALLRTTRNVLARILLVTCGAVSLGAISLTGSRIALIGLIAIAIFYTVESKHKILTFVGCILIGTAIFQLLPRGYILRYLTVEYYAQGGQLDASNELRLQIWRVGERIFLKYPILGVGAGQFSTAYAQTSLGGRHAAWMNPHNLLLQVACELGLVGLAAFVYFMWQIVKGIRFVLRKKSDRGFALNYQLAIACSVMCIGVLILSLVGHTLYRPYWYLLAGLVAANRNIVYAKLKKRVKSHSQTSEVSYNATENLTGVDMVSAVSTSSVLSFEGAPSVTDRIKILYDRR